MSGHNKWSTIKHKKGKLDAQRGKLFTKLIREIQSAVRSGGEFPESNPRLRLAIAKAKDSNMPNDNIKRAIQKAAGGEEGTTLEEIIYEGYAPNGVAILVKCLTDNKNRTLPVIRNIITKNGGSMGSAGSVVYLFAQKGQIIFGPGTDENKVMEIAIDLGAEDVQVNEDTSIEVVCASSNLEDLRAAFEKQQIPFKGAEISMIPSTYVMIDNKETAQKILKIIDTLEEEDDVQDVFTNLEIAEGIMESL